MSIVIGKNTVAITSLGNSREFLASLRKLGEDTNGVESREINPQSDLAHMKVTTPLCEGKCVIVDARNLWEMLEEIAHSLTHEMLCRLFMVFDDSSLKKPTIPNTLGELFEIRRIFEKLQEEPVAL